MLLASQILMTVLALVLTWLVVSATLHAKRLINVLRALQKLVRAADLSKNPLSEHTKYLASSSRIRSTIAVVVIWWVTLVIAWGAVFWMWAT